MATTPMGPPPLPVRMERYKPVKSFLSLPREIRDVIYEHALVNEGPINIHCNEGRYAMPFGNHHRSPHLTLDLRTLKTLFEERRDAKRKLAQKEKWDIEKDSAQDVFGRQSSWIPSVEGLCLNLLLSSRQVFREAAATLYGLNAFKLTQDLSNWFGLCDFLGMIGHTNRCHSRRLSVDIHPYRMRLGTFTSPFP